MVGVRFCSPQGYGFLGGTVDLSQKVLKNVKICTYIRGTFQNMHGKQGGYAKGGTVPILKVFGGTVYGPHFGAIWAQYGRPRVRFRGYGLKNMVAPGYGFGCLFGMRGTAPGVRSRFQIPNMAAPGYDPGVRFSFFERPQGTIQGYGFHFQSVSRVRMQI